MALFLSFVCRLTVDSGRVNDLDGLLTGVSAGEGKGEVPSVMDRLFSEETRGDTGRTNGRDLLSLCSL